jgi:hypothetical protein
MVVRWPAHRSSMAAGRQQEPGWGTAWRTQAEPGRGMEELGRRCGAVGVSQGAGAGGGV